MKVTHAKILMRSLGTLAGVLGIVMLFVLTPVLFSAISKWDPWVIALLAFSFLVATYLVYVAYLVWFRFSPLAVRHVCGAVGFYLFVLTAPLYTSSNTADAVWPAYLFFGCLVLTLCGYRFASRHLTRLLFPANSSQIQP